MLAEAPPPAAPAGGSTLASAFEWLCPKTHEGAAGQVDEDDEPRPPGCAMGDIPGSALPASDAAREAAAGVVQEGPVTGGMPAGCPDAEGAEACGGCIADAPDP
mmetsp:Transcript_135353/g.246156  ORF Transcript_135353/g.246156 Transcript_135353/m.246156 type:complete len:104 (+) Transcript_135353:594-905(+)